MIRLLALVLFGISTTAHGAKHCEVDSALRALGWVEHSEAEMAGAWQRMEEASRSPGYRKDIETTYSSRELNGMVNFLSFDSLETPQDEMFGDVAFYRSFGTGEPLEIRWYEGGKKHFAHRSSRCSVDVVPWAVNALF